MEIAFFLFVFFMGMKERKENEAETQQHLLKFFLNFRKLDKFLKNANLDISFFFFFFLSILIISFCLFRSKKKNFPIIISKMCNNAT